MRYEHYILRSISSIQSPLIKKRATPDLSLRINFYRHSLLKIMPPHDPHRRPTQPILTRAPASTLHFLASTDHIPISLSSLSHPLFPSSLPILSSHPLFPSSIPILSSPLAPTKHLIPPARSSTHKHAPHPHLKKLSASPAFPSHLLRESKQANSTRPPIVAHFSPWTPNDQDGSSM
jgi:hypothetical protein